MDIEAIDFFCGVGGLTSGVQQAGIKVVAGYDIENECKFAYETNNSATFINKDIRHINSDEVDSLFSPKTNIKVLMGCAPCQPYSSYS